MVRTNKKNSKNTERQEKKKEGGKGRSVRVNEGWMERKQASDKELLSYKVFDNHFMLSFTPLFFILSTK